MALCRAAVGLPPILTLGPSASQVEQTTQACMGSEGSPFQPRRGQGPSVVRSLADPQNGQGRRAGVGQRGTYSGFRQKVPSGRTATTS